MERNQLNIMRASIGLKDQMSKMITQGKIARFVVAFIL